MSKARASPANVKARAEPHSGRRAIQMRLRRIEGQLRAIQTLVESGADCEQVAQQMAASRAALDRAFFAMVSCAIDEVIAEGGSAEQLSTRLATVNGVLMRFG